MKHSDGEEHVGLPRLPTSHPTPMGLSPTQATQFVQAPPMGPFTPGTTQYTYVPIPGASTNVPPPFTGNMPPHRTGNMPPPPPGNMPGMPGMPISPTGMPMPAGSFPHGASQFNQTPFGGQIPPPMPQSARYVTLLPPHSPTSNCLKCFQYKFHNIG